MTTEPIPQDQLLKTALLYGYESTLDILNHHDRYFGRDTKSNLAKAIELEQQIACIKAAQAMMDREHELTFKSYEYSCGDGCCYEQGVEAHLDGDYYMGGFPDESYVIEDVLAAFGIELTITREY